MSEHFLHVAAGIWTSVYASARQSGDNHKAAADAADDAVERIKKLSA